MGYVHVGDFSLLNFRYVTSHRLRTGWSTGKSTSTSPSTSTSLDPSEREAILEVIRRNEQLEVAERQRVGRIVERVENIKQRAAECGPRNCRYVSFYLPPSTKEKSIEMKLIKLFI